MSDKKIKPISGTVEYVGNIPILTAVNGDDLNDFDLARLIRSSQFANMDSVNAALDELQERSDGPIWLVLDDAFGLTTAMFRVDPVAAEVFPSIPAHLVTRCDGIKGWGTGVQGYGYLRRWARENGRGVALRDLRDRGDR